MATTPASPRTRVCDPARTFRLLSDLTERAYLDPQIPLVEWTVRITGQADGTLNNRDSRVETQRTRLQRWVDLTGVPAKMTERVDGETTYLTAGLRLQGVPVTLTAVCPPYRPALCGHQSDEGLSCMMRPGHTGWAGWYRRHMHRAEDGSMTYWECNQADLRR